MFVASRMTKNPITVEPSTPVNEAAKLMKRRNIRRLPVVENGSLVGIISDRDIMRVAPSPATTLSKFEIMSLPTLPRNLQKTFQKSEEIQRFSLLFL